MLYSLAVAVSIIFSTASLAIPLELQGRQAFTPLSSSQIAAFKPYSFYASTGYCLASQTIAWDCGADCEANADFEPIASGGNGDEDAYCRSIVIYGSSGKQILILICIPYRVCGIRSRPEDDHCLARWHKHQ